MNKTAVEFSPNFTLEGSTSNIAIHNELLASANADYGNGKLKLTSMRQTKGGEAVQIAATDLSNMTISQNATRSAKTANANYDTGLQVASYTNVTLSPPHYTVIGLHSGAADPDTVLDAGDVLYNSAGLTVGTVDSFAGGAGSYTIKLTGLASADKPSVGQNLYRSSTRSVAGTTLSVDSTSTFPSKGLLMIVNGASTRVFSYTGKTDITFTGVAVVGGGAALTQLDTAGTALTQFFFQSDIGAFSDAGGDQARLKDWCLTPRWVLSTSTIPTRSLSTTLSKCLTSTVSVMWNKPLKKPLQKWLLLIYSWPMTAQSSSPKEVKTSRWHRKPRCGSKSPRLYYAATLRSLCLSEVGTW